MSLSFIIPSMFPHQKDRRLPSVPPSRYVRSTCFIGHQAPEVRPRAASCTWGGEEGIWNLYGTCIWKLLDGGEGSDDAVLDMWGVDLYGDRPLFDPLPSQGQGISLLNYTLMSQTSSRNYIFIIVNYIAIIRWPFCLKQVWT